MKNKEDAFFPSYYEEEERRKYLGDATYNKKTLHGRVLDSKNHSSNFKN